MFHYLDGYKVSFSVMINNHTYVLAFFISILIEKQNKEKFVKKNHRFRNRDNM